MHSSDSDNTDLLTAAQAQEVVDTVAVAKLYGEPLFAMPNDLYIPPDALKIFLEAFEGPLDLLLYLIRKQNFNILDIPMAQMTVQYMAYVEEIRQHNLELAAEYLLMAAMLIEIKSRMLLPPKKVAPGEEAEDPRAELVRMSIVLKRLQGQRFLEFERLFDEGSSLPVVVITFIALLELARENLLEITQGAAFPPIYVRLAYAST